MAATKRRRAAWLARRSRRWNKSRPITLSAALPVAWPPSSTTIPTCLRAEPAWAERAGRLAARTVTFTQLLGELAGLPAGALDDGQATTVTYHDFCQGRNVLHQTEAPRHILRDLLGCQVVELPEAVCCGFGGSRSVIYPAVAAAIAERKLTAIASTGASIVVTDNPGCIAHLRAILRKRGSPLQVLHIAEVVAARLG